MANPQKSHALRIDLPVLPLLLIQIPKFGLVLVLRPRCARICEDEDDDEHEEESPISEFRINQDLKGVAILISLAHRHSALPDSPEDNRFGSAAWRFLADWWSSA